MFGLFVPVQTAEDNGKYGLELTTDDAIPGVVSN